MAVALAVSAVAGRAGAEQPGPPVEPAPQQPDALVPAEPLPLPAAPLAPSPARRGLALGATLVPGLALHGAGHIAAGDRTTGLRLLAWEGIGIASLITGVGGLALTGASSRTVGLFIPLMIGGAGLFGTTWLSDVYGVAAAPRVPGVPRPPPGLEAQAGLRYVYDPVFTYRTLLVAALDWRTGPLRLSPSAWLATNGDNQRLRLEGAWRLLGPRPGVSADSSSTLDGSYLDLEVAATHHRYVAEREQFAFTLGEISVGARLDLRRAARSLDGSFVEGALGWAAGGITYFDRTTDATDLLLGRLGWGLYWGRGTARHGEVALVYDHRHDGYAGGMKLSGLGSGTMGSFGVRTFGMFSPWLGVNAEARVGSAIVVGASLLVRPGGTK